MTHNAHMTFFSSEGFTATVTEAGYDTVDLSIHTNGVHCRFFLDPKQAVALSESLNAFLKACPIEPEAAIGGANAR